MRRIVGFASSASFALVAGAFAVLLLAAGGSARGGSAESFADFAWREPSRGDLDFVRSHVRFLSDDLLEGRGPGTRGGELAARYLAAQLDEIGIEPGGGDGTYFQKVPLLGVKTDYAQSTASLVVTNEGVAKPIALPWLDSFVATDESQRGKSEIDAEMVFVGYGITAPEHQWDDWKGADVKGKVVLMLVNDPPSEDVKVFGGKGLTYYGRWTYKYEEAARRGAAGCVLMHRDDLAAYGWNVVRTSFARERPYVDGRNDGKQRLALAGWATEGKTREIVEAAGKKLDELIAAAATKEFQPVPLGAKLKATLVTQLRPFETPNVIGLLRGGARGHEAVVYSAHWDHLGRDDELIKEGKDGIYNGAVDNATGCAAVLWLAREFANLEQRPDRSIVFLFTTAEEGGLRGSEYYASHPTFPAERIAADLNLDGLTVSGEPLQFEPLGYERSTLRRSVELAAREFAVELLPDSKPELGTFYRSDHFPFARAGVPAINFKAGPKLKGLSDEAGEQWRADYTKNRYHQPSDEYDPNWDLAGVVKTARFAGRIGLRVANDPEFPRYLAGDEFARK